MDSIIRVEHLDAEFGGKKILKDINLEIAAKDITIILGSSGCGKTTLFKHLIGLYPPQQGKIQVFDFTLNDISEEAYEKFTREIGVLFQNSALFNSLTIEENLSIPLEQNTTLPRQMIQRLVAKKLELVNLREVIHYYPGQLSGGMRKRVALARALAMDPPLLFCDEPSAGLDPVTLNALDNLFLKLKEMLNITIVMVTHAIPTIRRLADRLIFMEEGRILFTGTYQEALKSGNESIVNFFNEKENS
jgi:phospholipid/cholesterol/gamma-HCH transport system ATP-binding protein